jgi:hypothetical protein
MTNAAKPARRVRAVGRCGGMMLFCGPGDNVHLVLLTHLCLWCFVVVDTGSRTKLIVWHNLIVKNPGICLTMIDFVLDLTSKTDLIFG